MRLDPLVAQNLFDVALDISCMQGLSPHLQTRLRLALRDAEENNQVNRSRVELRQGPSIGGYGA